MGFGEAIKVFFSKYADFSGRGRRSEFWFSYLFTYLANIIIFFAFVFLMIPFQYDRLALQIIASLGGLCVVAILIPYFSAVSRRLHDTNKSFGYFFISLIPLAGPILLIIALAQDSDASTNNYGAPVK